MFEGPSRHPHLARGLLTNSGVRRPPQVLQVYGLGEQPVVPGESSVGRRRGYGKAARSADSRCAKVARNVRT
jgi:hypothetical protein